MAILPPQIVLDPLLQTWLREDIGRGDHTTQGLFHRSSNVETPRGSAQWLAKEAGVIAGLPLATRIFQLLDPQVQFTALVPEGKACDSGTVIAQMQGPMEALLIGERTALNLTMRLSGVSSLTRQYADKIADLATRLVDTRKTTPGLRLLEKYATQLGGAINHRLGLDDAVMIKDNHIAAAGGIAQAVQRIRAYLPYPLTIEVETESLEQVAEALAAGVEIIMLDNMPIAQMREAVALIRQQNPAVKIEASGNITLTTLRSVAETGVDYISTSAPVTRSSWLDISMDLQGPSYDSI
ncbi:carboxylating nicotinate-nucleotide diphosphorylase [Leptolyngbya sp. FACHB-261]|uniref:carboxylating nicotinate-nucleotide diphosphorylase n=1 Tax=Leptolyngbya sp. FACHB-261 TaxID=2692806 RepID=UPI001689C781|nr:carboxylating nicotinate-nucleotide diphosphorylase [Leptolyngbya sp. FACHB-261]MBD2102310.1 carboxylating nicotinate-nucleotide diphosphorylase [Leptolyngbya sp. FACHB-261]